MSREADHAVSPAAFDAYARRVHVKNMAWPRATCHVCFGVAMLAQDGRLAAHGDPRCAASGEIAISIFDLPAWREVIGKKP